MALTVTANMSRTFRIFLLATSCMFAAFFVYCNMNVGPRLPHKKATLFAKHHHLGKQLPRNHDSTKRVRPRQNEASFSDAAASAFFVNSTLLGRRNNRLEDVKTFIDDIRTTEKNMLRHIEENQRQALKNADMSGGINEKLMRLREKNLEDSGESRSNSPILIVILARMRTGSSLMGEIFNQNPSIFFMYEPLITLDNSIRAGDISVDRHQDISSSLLREYSQCRFPKKATEAWMKWKAGLSRCARVLPWCPRSRRSGTPNCSKITVQNLVDICKTTHKRMCIKTIRADLDYLKPLVDLGINVKVIHLVRDPRGTANSRKQYYILNHARIPIGLWRNRTGRIPDRLPGRQPQRLPGQNAQNGRNETKRKFQGKLGALGLMGNYPDHVVHTIPRLCQWTRDSILQARKKPAWLRDRYKLVRYEDFALDPLRMTRDLYDFVGLNLPLSVMTWIVQNTRKSDERSAKLFSTHKDSVLTATRWRTLMKPAQVRQVEDACKEAMELLGYRRFTTSEELTNQSIPLMGPLPIESTV